MIMLFLILFFVCFTIYFLFFSSGNLVDWQLKLYLKTGLLRIDNYLENAIQPNSLDVHLGNNFAVQLADGTFKEIVEDEFRDELADFDRRLRERNGL